MEWNEVNRTDGMGTLVWITDQLGDLAEVVRFQIERFSITANTTTYAELPGTRSKPPGPAKKNAGTMTRPTPASRNAARRLPPGRPSGRRTSH